MTTPPDPRIQEIRVSGSNGFGGLYNAMFGDGNEINRIQLVAIVTGQDPRNFGRARDAWVERGPDGTPRFAVYTRNGGGNRPDYVPQILAMQSNQYYLEDHDDNFDTTYATFYFELPEQLAHRKLPEGKMAELQADWDAMRPQLIEQGPQEPVSMDDLWQVAIAKTKEDPEFAKQVLDQSGLAEQLKSIFEEKK